jgi:hypothetical protein
VWLVADILEREVEDPVSVHIRRKGPKDGSAWASYWTSWRVEDSLTREVGPCYPNGVCRFRFNALELEISAQRPVLIQFEEHGSETLGHCCGAVGAIGIGRPVSLVERCSVSTILSILSMVWWARQRGWPGERHDEGDCGGEGSYPGETHGGAFQLFL